MPLTIGTSRALLRGGKRYIDKVLGYGPIAYWPLNEQSGTVARCLVNPAQNGTYARDVSVMTTGAGIGDGNTAPLFDGTNDYVDIYSATLNAAFSGSEGTLVLWVRVLNVGVWTDGTLRIAARLYVNGTNYAQLARSGVNSTLAYDYTAGGVYDGVALGGLATTTWMQLGVTWSAAADQVRAYHNGIQTGATQTVLGAWAGALDAARTIIGAAVTPPAALWSGWLAHCIVWDRALAPAEIAALAVV